MSGTPAEHPTIERFGRPYREFKVAVSAEAMALAWARQEQGPEGATVVVEREVSPIGRRGRLWAAPAEATLAFSVVLRPSLKADDADAVWLLAAVGAAEGAEAASGKPLGIFWPDVVVDSAGEHVGMVKADSQLGPGEVRSAVVTVRLDMAALGMDPSRRDELLEAVLSAIDETVAGLQDDAAGPAAAYEGRCILMGKRVKVRLMPKGETRGVVRHVDRRARLELQSGTGMIERISIDMVGDLQAV